MRLMPLPDTVDYVLVRHREWDKDGKDQGPLQDVPVFVMETIKPREKEVWVDRIYGTPSAKDGTVEMKKDDTAQNALFEEKLRTIKLLTIGANDEPFDKSRHLDVIPFEWRAEVAGYLMSELQLTESAKGK